jgi:Zn-dependent peptidase ImmA (M78 family)/DNA-binding XRE family transcriptional regulator
MNLETVIFENFAQRFKSARVLNGFSLQDVADKLEELDKSITRQALYKYEKGDVIPDSKMIDLLSKALRVKPDFFFREQHFELGTISFRKLKQLSVKEENRIKEFTKDYLSRYVELEEIIGLNKAFKNPIVKTKAITQLEDIEHAASEVRKSWHLGNGPLSNTVEILENNHIKVMGIKADDEFDGLQSNINNNTAFPLIVYNASKLKSADRIRFTICHELGHLLLPISDQLPEKQQEQFCHQFAGALLFPKQAAIEEVGISRQRIHIQELIALKQQYGISIQALIMRLADLGIINAYYKKQLFFYINQNGWKVEEPGHFAGTESSNRFDLLLYRALAEELISINKAADLKNMKVAEFKTYLNTIE